MRGDVLLPLRKELRDLVDELRELFAFARRCQRHLSQGPGRTPALRWRRVSPRPGEATPNATADRPRPFVAVSRSIARLEALQFFESFRFGSHFRFPQLTSRRLAVWRSARASRCR